MKDIEVICVNDGSTDRSGAICEEFARNDSRFKVWHKKNEGVSATRQFGINHSHGEYVIHLDADDYAEEDAYEKMYSKGIEENADIIICDALRILQDRTEYMDFSLKEYSHAEIIRDLISSFGSVWNRMIRRSIIEECNASFPAYLQYGEDKVFLATLLGKSYENGRRFKICHIPEPLINYDTSSNNNSLSKLPPGDFVKKRMTMLTKVGEVINLKEFGQAYFSHIFQEAYSVLRNISYYDYSEEDYISTFKIFHQGIKDQTPFSLKKVLVSIALDKGYKTALRWRWILAPNILLDKIKRWKNKN